MFFNDFSFLALTTTFAFGFHCFHNNYYSFIKNFLLHNFNPSLISNKIEDKYGALRNLVPCVQFKKREKHPWRSATSKSNTPLRVFFTFFILYEWYQIAQRTTNIR